MSKKIIEILREINPYEQIDEDTMLIESGILDSLSILSLVTQLEEEFAIEIVDDAITAKNFATVSEIVQLVKESVKVGSEDKS